MKNGIGAVMPKFNMPYKIVETIAYDPAARDLSVEVAKAKATGADALLMVSRLNDAILLTRELVKQRWSPMAVLSMGPGWYEDQYLKTLGKLADGPLSFVPWYDPNKTLSKQLEAALAKAYPGRQSQHQPRLHVRGAAGRRRRLQARRLDRSEGAGRRHPHDQHHRQRQHRPRHPVRRQGPERQAEELGHPEPRRQAGDGGAEGRGQRQGRVADERLRQARRDSGFASSPAPAPRRSCRRPEPGLTLRIIRRARRNLSQRRRQRPVDRPRLRPDGARPVGDLRRRARGQFRPRRDDDHRDVSRGRAVRRASASTRWSCWCRSRRVLFALGYAHAGRAHQPVHQPAGAQPVHAAGRGRDHPGQRPADRLRARCAAASRRPMPSTASRSAR